MVLFLKYEDEAAARRAIRGKVDSRSADIEMGKWLLMSSSV